MVNFTGKEVRHLVVAALALGFVFGFDDKSPTFVLSHWLFNYFLVCLASAAVLLAYALAQKLVADRYGASSEFRLWSVQRFGFRPESKFQTRIPIGILIGIIVAFLSAGKFFFAGVASFELSEHRYKRIGRKYLNVTAMELGKIALAGVFAALLLSYVFSALHLNQQIILISSLFAVFQMIPLPHLDGVKVFFGSLGLFGFSAAFVLISALLVNFIPAGSALFYSLAGAGVFFILFFYYRIYSTK
jgi:hypothetical protein